VTGSLRPAIAVLHVVVRRWPDFRSRRPRPVCARLALVVPARLDCSARSRFCSAHTGRRQSVPPSTSSERAPATTPRSVAAVQEGDPAEQHRMPRAACRIGRPCRRRSPNRPAVRAPLVKPAGRAGRRSSNRPAVRAPLAEPGRPCGRRLPNPAGVRAPLVESAGRAGRRSSNRPAVRAPLAEPGRPCGRRLSNPAGRAGAARRIGRPCPRRDLALCSCAALLSRGPAPPFNPAVLSAPGPHRVCQGSALMVSVMAAA
jgi:hypothetical protein